MRRRTLLLIAALLIAAAAGCSDREDAPEPARADALPEGAIEGIDLQRIGTVGDYPDASVVVNVDAEGAMTVGPKTLNLAGLRKRLTGLPEAGVVLRMDRTLPWGIAQWLMQTCADPGVRITRVHFAVLPSFISDLSIQW